MQLRYFQHSQLIVMVQWFNQPSLVYGNHACAGGLSLCCPLLHKVLVLWLRCFDNPSTSTCWWFVDSCQSQTDPDDAGLSLTSSWAYMQTDVAQPLPPHTAQTHCMSTWRLTCTVSVYEWPLVPQSCKPCHLTISFYSLLMSSDERML